ncbi:hypothetical protein IE81DRAFT_319247 [Ceraceosorus guamensis]|uniref:Mediator complex subunit 19 n=1 Tax=Ceraceosorus guamensis TaxID=1522189 RepID=A0A316WF57_9BASI|nr:hypothetical protein IE81DRAFT_319247 [Ceraceosorus guamensis]PWN46343.1 hypothetical protein IE81DRAFT_319247 [Ceraceosorus guamensis]
MAGEPPHGGDHASDSPDLMASSSTIHSEPPAPLFYPAYVPPPSALPSQMLNGASNLIPKFGLLPLYLKAVKPYRRTGPNDDPSKFQKLPFTYEQYVEDLPGRVRPTKYQAKQPPAPPTMRDIVFRPETTLQRIVPFDEETLRTSFAVDAGPAEKINVRLLEADEPGARKPKKRKHKPGGDQDSPRREARHSIRQAR